VICGGAHSVGDEGQGFQLAVRPATGTVRL